MKIREICKDDIPRILEISEKLLGADYLGEDLLDYEGIYLCAEVDDKVVGFGIASVYEGTGWLNVVAVDPKYARQGIASALVVARIERLKKLGVKQILATAWKKGDQIPAGLLLEKHGFVEQCEVLRFFEDYDDCPHCQESPCSCSAVVYLKTI